MGNYLPIAEHGIIGDLHTVALVGTNGAIDWCCWPRFDSPSIFASILDSERGGEFRVCPASDDHTTKQLYFPDTNVLITRFLTPDGVGEVQDFMPIHRDPHHTRRIIRRVVVVRGQMHFRLACRPRFNYGRDEHEVVVHPHGIVFHSPALSLSLESSVPLEARGPDACAEFTLSDGDSATFSLEGAARGHVPTGVRESEAAEAFNRTVRFWRGWLAKSRYRGRWREMVKRRR
jgi:GH15 family glucan-1,4-alpha-glucosidase